jgi:D-alanyl-D-alanine carboxypeptidase/D-alanyl-D-alanine-endopeptidase (penicillin-binding protein 4)
MISAMFLKPLRSRKFLIAASLTLGLAFAPANGSVAREPSSSTKTLAAPSPVISSVPAASAGKPRKDVALFRKRVEAALSEAHAQKGLWGVLVTDRDTGNTLYELNADRFFTPASNAKIFTSALALATLGRDYRFRTTLESPGTIDSNGLLAGDLVLVGRGDPDLSNRVFPYAGKAERDGPVEKILAELVDAAVAKGLKEVDGDVVGDDSYFPYDPFPAGWSVGDLFFSFGAPVSAISFNDNSFSIAVQPGARAGDPATVVVEPEVAQGTFASELTTGPSDEKPDFAVTRRPGTNFILVRGTIPVGHVPMNLDFATADPAETAARTLKQLLEARGVRITGGIRVEHAAPPDTSDARDLPPSLASMPPASASTFNVLAEHVSQPLLESVRLMNKISQNLHAELLLRTVAREKTGIGSTDDGLKVEQSFLKAAGVADGDVALSDGSGLSRDDLVTPRGVIALLHYAAQQPWGQDYLSTLPIAGVDGTLENRMKSTSASGLIQAKTCSLEHVRGMSGYATTLRGEHLVFAIFGNNNPEHGHDATEALDAICIAMVETLGASTPVHSNKKK